MVFFAAVAPAVFTVQVSGRRVCRYVHGGPRYPEGGPWGRFSEGKIMGGKGAGAAVPPGPLTGVPDGPWPGPPGAPPSHK